MKEVRTYVKEVLAQTMVWCDRQDRSEYETRQRLQKLELDAQEVDWIIQELQAGDYQSDARFAESFVSGHFRIKKWGRLKIRNGLKMKGVTGNVAQEAMENIDPELYLDHMQSYFKTKGWDPEKSISFKEKQRLLRSGYQRGYEPELIRDLLSD